MKVIYAQQPIEKSIFLVGPTPRRRDVATWRPEALHLLEHDLKFNGTVLVPETEGFLPNDNYDNQVHWEWEGLNTATVVACWVPRDMKDMPAFTTNVEFGMMVASGKVVLGFPPKAPKMRYLQKLADRYNAPVFGTLLDTLAEAVHRTRVPFGQRTYA
jgi:hypothetical protein